MDIVYLHSYIEKLPPKIGKITPLTVKEWNFQKPQFLIVQGPLNPKYHIPS